jgi:hypothetical protein
MLFIDNALDRRTARPSSSFSISRFEDENRYAEDEDEDDHDCDKDGAAGRPFCQFHHQRRGGDAVALTDCFALPRLLRARTDHCQFKGRRFARGRQRRPAAPQANGEEKGSFLFPDFLISN